VPRESPGATATSDPGGTTRLTVDPPPEGPTSDLVGLPSDFPDSLEGMEPFAPLSGEPARAIYRPDETAGDGTGWDSEEIAVFRAGTWSRLALGALDLEQDLWPGTEPMGSGELSPNGRLIAWDTSDGVAVLDLYRGSTRLLMQGLGPVTGTRWLPDSDALLAVRPRGADRLLAVGTGRSRRAPVETLSATVLGSGDLGRITPSEDGALLTVLATGPGSAARPPRVLDGPAGGRWIQGWGAGSTLAYYPLLTRSGPHRLTTVDLEDSGRLGQLAWSSRVNTGLRVHGWAGDGSLLISVDGALTAWDPTDRVLSRVATLPASVRGGARGAAGLSVAPGLLTSP